MPRLARLPLVALLACAVAGCSGNAASPTPSTTKPTSPTPTPKPTPAPTIDPDACPVPPPSDVIPEGYVLDADEGTARAALCVDDEPPIEIEFAACTWIPDRESIEWAVAFSGSDAPSWSAQVEWMRDRDAALTLFHGVVDNEPGVSYAKADSGLVTFAVADDGKSGAIRFEGFARTDSNDVPDVTPAVSGLVRWACDDPPPPVAGKSTGWVRVDVDGRADAIQMVDATCRWVLLDGAPILFNLETSGVSLRFDDVDVGLSINRSSLGSHELPEINFYVSDPEMGGVDASGRWRYPLTLSADQSSGTMRYRGFTYGPGVNSTPLPDFSSGIVSWHCDSPIAGPPDAPEGYAPHEVPPTSHGTGVLRLGHPLDDDLAADVTCVIQNPDPVNPESGPLTPEIREVRVEAKYRGERLIYTTMWGEGVLVRMDRNAQPLGEYVARPFFGWGGGEPGVGPIRVPIGPVVFEPTDPRYVPLGGPGGPLRFELTVTVDCPSS